MGLPWLVVVVLAGSSPEAAPAEDLAAARAEFERALVETVAATNLADLTFVADRSGTWAAFGEPGQRSLCVEAAPRSGCVRLSGKERPTEALEDARRRLPFGDVAPPPRGILRLFEVLEQASSTLPSGFTGPVLPISFLPLELAEDRVLRVAGAEQVADRLRVLDVRPTSARRLATPARGGGWAVMDGRVDEHVYGVGVVRGAVADREVFLVVAGTEDGGSGLAGGRALLSLATFDGDHALQLVAQKVVGAWTASGKGWSTSGPTEQAWLWPSVTPGQVRMQRSAPPTRWLRRGSQRFATPSPAADPEWKQRLADIAASQGTWCWEGTTLAQCAPGR